MSSSSDCEEENTMEKTDIESKVNKGNEPKLEADLKSLQIKDTNEKARSSTIDEGITDKKKSSVHYLYYEESVRNTDRPEAVRNMDFSNELSSRQNTFRTRSTAEEGAGASNWRSLHTNYPKEKEEYTSGSRSLSWRDPKFKYERCKQNNTSVSPSQKWRNEDLSENRYRSFEDESVYLPSFARNRDTSKIGNWALPCAPDILLDNGLTEVEHVWNCVKELYEQNGELFAKKRPTESKSRKGYISINCYTSNYEDKVHIAKVADILIEKIRHYPYCFLYFHEYKPLYMRTCEKELYELNGYNWKLIDFDE